MKFCKSILITLLLVLILTGGGGREPDDASLELLMDEVDFLVSDIEEMYAEIRPRLLIPPGIDADVYIAFADIDFDGTPEFFFGWTYDGLKIWYRAYLLQGHLPIDSEHGPYWYTYLNDEACDFFAWPDNFFEGYYLDKEGKLYFVTKAYGRTIMDPGPYFLFIEYSDSTLIVRDGYECDEDLLEIKQAWATLDLSRIRDSIIELYHSYMDAG